MPGKYVPTIGSQGHVNRRSAEPTAQHASQCTTLPRCNATILSIIFFNLTNFCHGPIGGRRRGDLAWSGPMGQQDRQIVEVDKTIAGQIAGCSARGVGAYFGHILALAAFGRHDDLISTAGVSGGNEQALLGVFGW